MELKERLRKVESSREYAGAELTTNWYRNPDGPEAAARIEALEGALREIEGITSRGQLPITHQINEIARAALKARGIE